MRFSDDDLLDFDSSNYAKYDEEKARGTLAELGDVFRSHLAIARSLDYWASRLPVAEPNEFQRGYERALREVAAHLRQGDYVPGGVTYENMFK